jgi:hypothetical protein
VDWGARWRPGQEILREALRQRDPRVAPIETLRRLAHWLAAEQSPLVRFSAGSQGFIETIEGSETLKARARAIRDEFAQVVAVALSECVGREPTDPIAHLAAGLPLATWTVALIEAHRTIEHPRVPMHIGEISKGSGISTSCTRHYEKHGVASRAVREKLVIKSIQTRGFVDRKAG